MSKTIATVIVGFPAIVAALAVTVAAAHGVALVDAVKFAGVAVAAYTGITAALALAVFATD